MNNLKRKNTFIASNSILYAEQLKVNLSMITSYTAMFYFFIKYI